LKNTGGFSVAEILVCLMLIGLIVIMVLPSITYGFIQLNESGERTKAVYTVRQAVENELANATPGPTPDTLRITFNRDTIAVKGRIMETEATFGTKGDRTRIRVFIPNK